MRRERQTSWRKIFGILYKHKTRDRSWIGLDGKSTRWKFFGEFHSLVHVLFHICHCRSGVWARKDFPHCVFFRSNIVIIMSWMMLFFLPHPFDYLTWRVANLFALFPQHLSPICIVAVENPPISTCLRCRCCVHIAKINEFSAAAKQQSNSKHNFSAFFHIYVLRYCWVKNWKHFSSARLCGMSPPGPLLCRRVSCIFTFNSPIDWWKQHACQHMTPKWLATFISCICSFSYVCTTHVGRAFVEFRWKS